MSTSSGSGAAQAGKPQQRASAEHHAELLSDYAERGSAQARFLAVAVAAALGIFLLLQVAFASWRLAAAVFLALPGALVGGVLAAHAVGGTISIGMLVGFLAVVAISARACWSLPASVLRRTGRRHLAPGSCCGERGNGSSRP